MLGRLSWRVGVRHVSAHCLRHHNLTTAFARGADLLTVQRDAGHASIRTTQRYLHAATGLARTTADYVLEALEAE